MYVNGTLLAHKIKVMHQIFNKFKSIFKHTDNLQVS